MTSVARVPSKWAMVRSGCLSIAVPKSMEWKVSNLYIQLNLDKNQHQLVMYLRRTEENLSGSTFSSCYKIYILNIVVVGLVHDCIIKKKSSLSLTRNSKSCIMYI